LSGVFAGRCGEELQHDNSDAAIKLSVSGC